MNPVKREVKLKSGTNVAVWAWLKDEGEPRVKLHLGTAAWGLEVGCYLRTEEFKELAEKLNETLMVLETKHADGEGERHYSGEKPGQEGLHEATGTAGQH